MVALNETKDKLEDELRMTSEKLSEIERQLEQEKIERQRIQEEFDVISTATSSMQVQLRMFILFFELLTIFIYVQNSRKEDAVSVSSLDFEEKARNLARFKKSPVS